MTRTGPLRDARSAPTLDDVDVMSLQARDPCRPRPDGTRRGVNSVEEPSGGAVGASDSSDVWKMRSARCWSVMPSAPFRRGRRGRRPRARPASRRGRERAETWRFPRGSRGSRPPRRGEADMVVQNEDSPLVESRRAYPRSIWSRGRIESSWLARLGSDLGRRVQLDNLAPAIARALPIAGPDDQPGQPSVDRVRLDAALECHASKDEAPPGSRPPPDPDRAGSGRRCHTAGRWTPRQAR